MPHATRTLSPAALSLSLAAITAFAAGAGCAGSAKLASAPAAVPQEAAPVLDRSVFARDPQGQLTEDAIQRILGSQLELELPARVGILPVLAAETWRGPGPSYARAPIAVAELAENVRSPDLFTLVTEMLPIPSGALGMEALREMAARYKLRYVILYREDIRQRERLNPWAVGYATLVGALFLPGEDLKVDGYVEASVFDVKTGLLLMTVRRRVAASRKSNVWHQEDKLDDLQAALAFKAGEDLAADLRRGMLEYAAAVRVENDKLAASPPAAAPPVAAGGVPPALDPQ